MLLYVSISPIISFLSFFCVSIVFVKLNWHCLLLISSISYTSINGKNLPHPLCSAPMQQIVGPRHGRGSWGKKRLYKALSLSSFFGGVEATKDCLIRPSVRLPFLQQLPRGSPIATKSSCFICHFKTNNASFSFLRSVYKARQGTTTNILRNQFSTVNHSLSEDILPSKLKRLRFFPEKVSAFFGLFPVFFRKKAGKKRKLFPEISEIFKVSEAGVPVEW